MIIIITERQLARRQSAGGHFAGVSEVLPGGGSRRKLLNAVLHIPYYAYIIFDGGPTTHLQQQATNAVLQVSVSANKKRFCPVDLWPDSRQQWTHGHNRTGEV